MEERWAYRPFPPFVYFDNQTVQLLGVLEEFKFLNSIRHLSYGLGQFCHLRAAGSTFSMENVKQICNIFYGIGNAVNGVSDLNEIFPDRWAL